MKCPVCRSYSSQEVGLHSEQFAEELVKCNICGSEWAINHGLVEVVRDTQKNSFLEALTECVEGDDYSWAAA